MNILYVFFNVNNGYRDIAVDRITHIYVGRVYTHTYTQTHTHTYIYIYIYIYYVIYMYLIIIYESHDMIHW